MLDRRWLISEAGDLLARSEARLTALEAKGPALAAVVAIVAAAVGSAISLTWGEASTLARVLLLAAAACGARSLRAPLALAGPVRRETVTPATVEAAAREPDPAGHLARCQFQAATVNELTIRRLSDLQAASCQDLVRATLLFGLWAVVALAD